MLKDYENNINICMVKIVQISFEIIITSQVLKNMFWKIAQGKEMEE